MKSEVKLTVPVSRDGYEVNQLIKRCQPLDENSVYCNLLQCDHFSQTSVIAKEGSDTVGFVSGYRVPERPEVLFVWQVAVDQRMRGTGLGTRMLKDLINRVNPDFIETTITDENGASWALFTRFAERNNVSLKKTVHYLHHEHFNGLHDSEWLVRIGPFYDS